MDRLERVARAICRAKGFDPDARDGGWTNVVGVGAADGPSQLNWTYFADDASAFIAAHEALMKGGD